MPLVPTDIAWTPVPGSTSTLVEFKAETDAGWTVATGAGANPTIFAHYTIQLNSGVQYYYRLTTNCSGKAPSSITGPMKTGASLCCPAGYTLTADQQHCQLVQITPATAPTTQQITVAKSFITYGCWGANIYNAGYGLNGVGAFTHISDSNPFWINGTGYPNVPTTATNGRMNQAGLWSTTVSDNQTVGFSVCIDIPVTATYLVGIAGDNIPKISLDGIPIVTMDPTALGNYMASHGYSAIAAYPDEAAFRFWNIYPITIQAGTKRVLTMTCQNTTSVAAMACEIYNATPAELLAATSYATLGSKLVFSSKNFIGQNVQIGTNGVGYSCANGDLVLCDGTPYCKKILTTGLISC